MFIFQVFMVLIKPKNFLSILEYKEHNQWIFFIQKTCISCSACLCPSSMDICSCIIPEWTLKQYTYRTFFFISYTWIHSGTHVRTITLTSYSDILKHTTQDEALSFSQRNDNWIVSKSDRMAQICHSVTFQLPFS